MPCLALPCLALTQEHLARHLVANFSERDAEDNDRWLYIGSALVLRRPKT